MREPRRDLVKQTFNIRQFLLYAIVLLGFASYQTVQILSIDLPKISTVIENNVDHYFYSLLLLALPVYITVFLYLPTLFIIHSHLSFPFFGSMFNDYMTIIGFIVMAFGFSIAIYIFIHTILSTIPRHRSKTIMLTVITTSGVLIGALFTYRPFVLGSKLIYAKHIFMYIIISTLIIYIAVKILNSQLHKHDLGRIKTKVLRLFTLLFVVITLTLLSRVQLSYINNYTIPPLLSCSYYDKFNNLIYNTQYAGKCSTLNNLEITDNQLSFTVHEDKFRYDDEDSDYSDYPLDEKYTIDTTVTYTYDEANRVTEYQIEQVNKLYVMYPEKTEYELFLVETYQKHIINSYEERKVTSTHTVYKDEVEYNQAEYHHIDEIYETIWLDYSFELVSQLNETKGDKGSFNYTIDIDYRNLKLNETEYTELYDIRVDHNHDQVLYVIEEPSQDEVVIIEKTYSNSPYSYQEIDRRFQTAAFGGLAETIRSDRFRTFDEQLYGPETILSSSTNTHINYRTNQNYNNGLILDSEIQDDDWLTSVIEKTNFGFMIKHYSLERETDGQFVQYPHTVNYNPGFKEYNALIKNEQINNHHQAIFDPRYVEVEFIYQKNPLLFEDYFE